MTTATSSSPYSTTAPAGSNFALSGGLLAQTGSDRGAFNGALSGKSDSNGSAFDDALGDSAEDLFGDVTRRFADSLDRERDSGAQQKENPQDTAASAGENPGNVLGVAIETVDSLNPEMFIEGGLLNVVDASDGQTSAADPNYYQINAYVDKLSYDENVALNAIKVVPNAANNLWNQNVDLVNAVLYDAQYAYENPLEYLDDRLNTEISWVKNAASTVSDIVKDGPREVMNFLTSPDFGAVKDFVENGLSAESWEKSLTVLGDIGLGEAGSAAIGSIKGSAVFAGVNKGIDANDVSALSVDAFGGPKTTSRTGVGATGEGIPIERTKPEVLKEVHPDSMAAYGYSPKKGTAYEKVDFTDIDAAKKNRDIRTEYLDGSMRLENDIKTMRAKGSSSEEIGRHVVNERNLQKVDARKYMKPDEVKVLEERNLKKYNNPIGPTADDIFEGTKENLIDKGLYESDTQVWNHVIEKSMKKDDVINTLLGIEH